MRIRAFFIGGLSVCGLLCLTACGNTNMTTANISGTMDRVITRHDTYVKADKTLSPEVQASYLGDTAFLTTELTKPSIPGSEIDATFGRVAARHDAYVKADPTLPAYKSQIDLQDTALLEEDIKQSESGIPITLPPAAPITPTTGN